MKIELPDFEEFFEIAEKIKSISLEVENLKLNLEMLEKDIILKATGTEEYYVNGKAPSMDYIKNTFKVTGFNGELVPLRQKEIILDADLEFLKRRYEILKILCDLWRTQASNERNALNV